MRYEHIIKREDKSHVKVEVRFSADRYTGNKGEYAVEIYHKAPKKRTWVGFNTDDYTWRGLPFGSQEREDYEMTWKLKYVTEEEIREAKELCWLSFKPE